jgi:hypothetical protein
MTGLGFDLYNPEPISFSQDSHGLFLGVKVFQIQGSYFGGPGAGIIEQMKEGIIPEPLFCLQANRLENLQDFILIKKTHKRFLSPFLGDIKNGVCHFPLFRVSEANHFGKALEGCKPLVSGLDPVFSLFLKVFKEGDN